MRDFPTQYKTGLEIFSNGPKNYYNLIERGYYD